MAKHYGEDLCFEQDAVVIQKYNAKIQKKNQKSSLSRKHEMTT